MENIVVDFPLRGEWIYLRSFGHHPHAYDFVKIGNNRKYYSNGNLLSYIFGRVPANFFYCWSAPIYSPVAGVVIKANDGWPDNKVVNLASTIILWIKATFLFRPAKDGPDLDIRPNAGNYIMIQSESGFIAFMAHMRSGSIKVKTGQQVAEGQAVGEVGNSGNTTMPHLHINLFDQMNDPYQAKVIPFVFRSFERRNGNNWESVQNNTPKIKGEAIRKQL